MMCGNCRCAFRTVAAAAAADDDNNDDDSDDDRKATMTISS